MLHWSIVTHAQARRIADAKHLPHCAIRKNHTFAIAHKKRKAKAFLSHRGSRSRTRIDGFGDRFPTIRRFPFIRKKGSFASVLAFRCSTHPQNRIYLSHSSKEFPAPPVFFFGQALVRLVAVSSIHYCTSTPALSTSSSPRGLTSLKEWEISSWRGLHA